MITYFVDLDGTIIDPKPGMVGAFCQALREMGREDLASGDLDWIIGPPVIGSFTALLGEIDQAAEALRCYRRYYTPEGLLFDFSIYPGILDSIARLRAEGQLFVCTMKPEALAGPILARLELPVGLFGADLGGELKAKDQILDRAVAELSVNPADCLVIGDRGSDMAAAAKSGMPSLGVSWGYGTVAELHASGAHGLCHSPVDLAQAVQKLIRQKSSKM